MRQQREKLAKYSEFPGISKKHDFLFVQCSGNVFGKSKSIVLYRVIRECYNKSFKEVAHLKRALFLLRKKVTQLQTGCERLAQLSWDICSK